MTISSFSGVLMNDVLTLAWQLSSAEGVTLTYYFIDNIVYNTVRIPTSPTIQTVSISSGITGSYNIDLDENQFIYVTLTDGTDTYSVASFNVNDNDNDNHHHHHHLEEKTYKKTKKIYRNTKKILKKLDEPHVP